MQIVIDLEDELIHEDERSCESFGLIVDGWMPMPKVRRELGAE